MTGAQIEPGDLLYIRTNVPLEQANGRIVVCRYGDFEFVKRLSVAPDGSVSLASDPPKPNDLILSAEEAEALDVYGVVVQRLTPV